MVKEGKEQAPLSAVQQLCAYSPYSTDDTVCNSLLTPVLPCLWAERGPYLPGPTAAASLVSVYSISQAQKPQPSAAWHPPACILHSHWGIWIEASQQRELLAISAPNHHNFLIFSFSRHIPNLLQQKPLGPFSLFSPHLSYLSAVSVWAVTASRRGNKLHSFQLGALSAFCHYKSASC